jgi:hypothetical protein
MLQFIYCYAECHYGKRRYAQCRGARVIIIVSDHTMVDNSTHNYKIKGWNPATAFAKQKVMKKSFSCYKSFLFFIGAQLEKKMLGPNTYF